MTNSVHNINKVNSGTCPHGCAPGNCPICSGMGGSSLRAGEKIQKPGEMSYHQCAMIGAMMKARAARIEEHEKNIKAHMDILKSFETTLENISQKIINFTSKISHSTLLKPLTFTLNNLILPTVSLAKNITAEIKQLISKISQFKIDIQDKLNAIFGEAKTFIEKKVSEFVSVIKSKFKEIFRIFKRNKSDDEETKIDEDKKIFRLKNFINKIWKKQKDDTSEN